MNSGNLILVARIVLLGLAIALAALPLVVVLDLAAGGTGYGLCPNGVSECRNPYTAAPELSVILTLALMVVLAGLRILTKMSRRLRR